MAVSPDDVRAALQVPILEAGRTITADALEIAVAGTRGYPFMIQLVGLEAWRAAAGNDEMTSEHVRVGVERAQRKIGQLVHEPALADLSHADRAFLVAMAEDAQGPSRMADIAARLGVKANYASQYRLRLIEAEIIEAAGFGFVDFAIPYLREYLRNHASGGVETWANRGRGSI